MGIGAFAIDEFEDAQEAVLTVITGDRESYRRGTEEMTDRGYLLAGPGQLGGFDQRLQAMSMRYLFARITAASNGS